MISLKPHSGICDCSLIWLSFWCPFALLHPNTVKLFDFSMFHGMRRSHDRIVVWFTTTCTISAYHYLSSCRGVLDTTLCDKVCQWHATGRWFYPCTRVSSTNNTDRHDITEIFFRSGIKHHNPKPITWV